MLLAIAVVKGIGNRYARSEKAQGGVWNVASGAGAEVLALERFDPEGLPDYLAHTRPSLRTWSTTAPIPRYSAVSEISFWRLPAGGPKPIAAVSISS
jgi:hypothetical protein